MDSPGKILKALKQAKKILIPLHINIDGDSVGSALALHQLLRGWGKKVDVVTADPPAKIHLFLPGAKEIKERDPAEINLTQYDLFIAVDNGSLSRFSRKDNFKLPPNLFVINIDHHQTNDQYGDLNYVLPELSSTAELLFDLMKEWNLGISREVATCLLTGIFTDTVGFQAESTKSKSLEKAAELIKGGANYRAIINNMRHSWSPTALKLWTKILKNLRIQNRTAYSTLTKADVKNAGIAEQELSGARSFALNHLLRAVRDTDVAVLFYEERKGWVRCSLRSHKGFNVAKIAEKMGGGGHTHSAAFNFKGKMKDAIDKTLKLLSNN